VTKCGAELTEINNTSLGSCCDRDDRRALRRALCPSRLPRVLRREVFLFGGLMSGLIRVEDLHYTYGAQGDAPVEALRGIDLEIDRGEYVAVLGHNGSGKSTLARCLNGLLRPTRGEVWVGDKNTRDDEALVAIRASVGMVFQNPDNQFVTTVVEEEVAFGPENLGVPREELRRRVDRALEATSLGEARYKDPRYLSGGDKARLAIAGVLAMELDCLILDESTAMLDPAGRESILALLRRLHEQGLTIVAITHDMAEAVLAERAVVLERGKIALQGAPRQVFTRTLELRRLGLSLPAATAIAQGVRRRGVALRSDVLTQEELVDAALQVVEAVR